MRLQHDQAEINQKFPFPGRLHLFVRSNIPQFLAEVWDTAQGYKISAILQYFNDLRICHVTSLLAVYV